MPGHRTCARGHTWPADDAGRVDDYCPVCGEPALAEAGSPQTLLLRGRREVTSPLVPPSSATLPGGNGVSYPVARPEVPGYEILGELGRGGMGVVYKAIHLPLNRVVAVKMIHAEPGADPDQFARLRTEAEVIARLQHPNIIQVFEVGACPAGQFLVMEFASGGSLARRLDGTPLPPGLAAWLVETLARAVHAAHERGVVHRDLKPGNVQVLEDDSVPLGRCTL
ncbi:MAG: serine/threonine-protein kinase, partial [Gemmataceae bacterium]